MDSAAQTYMEMYERAVKRIAEDAKFWAEHDEAHRHNAPEDCFACAWQRGESTSDSGAMITARGYNDPDDE